MKEAMEITTFRLAGGQTIKAFIAANADVDAWLLKQPGFILRRICEAQDGSVLDILLWRSAKDGRRAATGVITELASSPVHEMIDQSSVAWSIHPCRHGVG